jgi:hypothetical protein
MRPRALRAEDRHHLASRPTRPRRRRAGRHRRHPRPLGLRGPAAASPARPRVRSRLRGGQREPGRGRGAAASGRRLRRSAEPRPTGASATVTARSRRCCPLGAGPTPFRHEGSASATDRPSPPCPTLGTGATCAPAWSEPERGRSWPSRQAPVEPASSRASRPGAGRCRIRRAGLRKPPPTTHAATYLRGIGPGWHGYGPLSGANRRLHGEGRQHGSTR